MRNGALAETTAGPQPTSGRARVTDSLSGDNMMGERQIEVPADVRAAVRLEGDAALESERLENLVLLLRERAARRSASSFLVAARAAREMTGEVLVSG